MTENILRQENLYRKYNSLFYYDQYEYFLSRNLSSNMTQRFERNSNNAKHLLRDWGKRLEFILNDYFDLANLHISPSENASNKRRWLSNFLYFAYFVGMNKKSGIFYQKL